MRIHMPLSMNSTIPAVSRMLVRISSGALEPLQVTPAFSAHSSARCISWTAHCVSADITSATHVRGIGKPVNHEMNWPSDIRQR